MNDVSGRRSRAGAYSVTNSAEQIATGTAIDQRDDRDEERAEQRGPHAELAGRGSHVDVVKKLSPAECRAVHDRMSRNSPISPMRLSVRHAAGARDDPVDLVGPRPGVRGPDALLLRARQSPELCTAMCTHSTRSRSPRDGLRGERHRNNDRQVRHRAGRAQRPVLTTALPRGGLQRDDARWRTNPGIPLSVSA